VRRSATRAAAETAHPGRGLQARDTGTSLPRDSCRALEASLELTLGCYRPHRLGLDAVGPTRLHRARERRDDQYAANRDQVLRVGRRCAKRRKAATARGIAARRNLPRGLLVTAASESVQVSSLRCVLVLGGRTAT